MGCGDGVDDTPNEPGDLGYDPALEAVRRVSDGTAFVAVAAAREVLEPIRKLHRRNVESPGECMHCGVWPCETAKLIYKTEELMWRQ